MAIGAGQVPEAVVLGRGVGDDRIGVRPLDDLADADRRARRVELEAAGEDVALGFHLAGRLLLSRKSDLRREAGRDGNRH